VGADGRNIFAHGAVYAPTGHFVPDALGAQLDGGLLTFARNCINIEPNI
jgi:hypothetical protein